MPLLRRSDVGLLDAVLGLGVAPHHEVDSRDLGAVMGPEERLEVGSRLRVDVVASGSHATEQGRSTSAE